MRFALLATSYEHLSQTMRFAALTTSYKSSQIHPLAAC